MRPGVGDVLGELGDEVQRVEDLEVPADAAEQIRARRLGEASAGFLLGEVDHLSLVSDADHALETERTSEHVVGEPLASGTVVGVQTDGVMDPEAARQLPQTGTHARGHPPRGRRLAPTTPADLSGPIANNQTAYQ